MFSHGHNLNVAVAFLNFLMLCIHRIFSLMFHLVGDVEDVLKIKNRFFEYGNVVGYLFLVLTKCL